ncbi:MAG: Serine/threonine-protein kinase PknB, partial [Planctomycetota bacterium]
RLFDRAAKVSDVERGAWLARECGQDEQLRLGLLALLADQGANQPLQGAGQTLREPDATLRPDASPQEAPAALNATTAPMGEGPGSVIGPYRLLQQIGEGGFGSVFLAEQTEPVARRVALKIVKLGMDTRQVVARFEQERQALALMDHPNIARVLDAGATATGRPYFAMDLVKGSPIVEYCDKNNLPIVERLALFEQVCNAVQHAHGKGIIHRDLKPSNVLVGMQDGKPHVKVIDFGIAKATNQRLTEKTLFTEHQQVIGTLQYMSPEQAEGSPDIDTRTDVYSLGVLLYELLTGSTPFAAETMRNAMFGELRRMIRETEPPRPSTRLHQSRETLRTIAARRRTEPNRLGTLIRGDLDWIVMKALEKDRSRRYETANGLAMDVRRHLTGEAVVAAPPSASYRLYKLVRRNKGVVAAAAAVAAALLVGLLGFAWQAKIARDERDGADVARLAEQEQRTLAETHAAEAKARADELKLVADFQADMLAQIDPVRAGMQLTADVTTKLENALATAQPPTAPEQRAAAVQSFRRQWQRINATDAARELIDRAILQPAVAAIDTQFAAQPLVAAQLRQSLALRYRKLGLYAASAPLQRSALAARRSLLGNDHEDTLLSIAEMASLLRSQGVFDESEALFREAVATYRNRFGDEHPATINTIGALGEMLWEAGRPAEAEPLLRDVLAKLRRIQGDDHPETLVVINNLGLLLSAQDHYAAAEPFYRESLERSLRVLGPDHPDTVVSQNNMGWLLQVQGRIAEAEPYFVEALAKRRRLLGDEHPITLNSINNLGMLAQMQGQLDKAEPLLREAFALRTRVLGEDHPDTLTSSLNYGLLLREQGKIEAAEATLRQGLALSRASRGDSASITLILAIALAGTWASQGRSQEVAELLAPAEAHARAVFAGPDSVRRLASLLQYLGEARAATARTAADYAMAAANLAEAIPLHERTRGPAHRSTVRTMTQLADLYAAWDKLEPNAGHAESAAAWSTKAANAK